MDAPWRIELFGGLRAQQGDRTITRFRTQKTGVLLAYLAYHRQRAHAREVLFELLWPETNPDAQRNSLSVSLSSLRHQLEPPGVPAGAVLKADRFSVQLNPAAVTTDVAEFEAALQAEKRTHSKPEQTQHLLIAVELYRGALLEGYYEDWILLESQRLSELFFQTLCPLVSLLEEAGDVNRAIQYAQRGVSVDPLREEVHYELIRLHAAAGQPTAALQQYAELERILRETFHDTPTPATRELVHNISHQLSVSNRLSAVSRQASERKRQRPVRQPPPTEDSQPQPTPESQPSTGRLPLTFTRFFGREEEIAWLQTTLLSEETRLVTLTGAGGSGKTRLALEAARRLVEPLRGAVWFVPLADLSDPRLIVDAMIDALRLTRSPHVEPIEQVVETLSRQPSLLVLDNLEHLMRDEGLEMRDEGLGMRDEKNIQTSSLISHPSSLILTLLERVPSLTLLVTSRQRLNLSGEREFVVSPLPTPSGEDTPEWLMRCESVQLFVDRAQAVKPDFQITKHNAAAIAELCYQLEGIPLALELAAARAQVLTPAQMLAHLENRFDFLVSRQRDATARHRTLRAAMDWSYHLLSAELQQFFARLSVFRGGWTVEAAEAVAGSGFWVLGSGDSPQNLKPKPQNLPFDVLDFLAQLRDCSLLTSGESETLGVMRFRMLETLREYGREQLSPDEWAALQRRHAEYYLTLAETAGPALTGGPEQGAWMNRLDADYDNLRAALTWTVESQPEMGLRSAVLGRFWWMRGYGSEGREWLERCLSRAPHAASALRAKALLSSGTIALNQGDYGRATTLLEESLSLSRQLGNKGGISSALNNLGIIAGRQGDYAKARVLYEETLELDRESGDKSGIATSLHNLGSVAQRQADYAQARAFFEEGLALRKEIDDQLGVASSLFDLSSVAREQGDYGQAQALLEECLAIARELGDKVGIALSLNDLGLAVRAQGDYARSCALFEESLSIQRELGSKPGVAMVLNNLGLGAYLWRDYARAQVFLEEALTIYRELGEQANLAGALDNLAGVAREQGDHARARALHAEGLKMWRDMDNKLGVAECVEGLGKLACVQGQAERAARLFGAAKGLREALGAPVPADEQPEHDRLLTPVRETLGEAAFIAAWEAGRALTYEQVVAYALEEGND